MIVKKQAIETREVEASNYSSALVQMGALIRRLENENTGFYILCTSIKPQPKESTYKLIVRYGCEVSEG